MRDTRLQRAESALDDARTEISEMEEDGIPPIPSIQDVRDSRELAAIHADINNLIRRVQALKGGKAS